MKKLSIEERYKIYSQAVRPLDMRDCKLKGIELAREVENRVGAFNTRTIYEPYPDEVIVSPEQFKEFAKLRGDETVTPTGKELFKTKYNVMDIKVVGEPNE